jgi:hypothetical protein
MAQVFGMAASLYDVDVTRQTRADALQWRAEDVLYRNETYEWRRQDVLWRQADLVQRDLDNRRREIDEKNEQLRSLSSVAAIIAGFALTVLVQISYPSNVPEWLLSLLSLSTASTVCLMTYSALVCTLMLVATLKRFEGRDGTAGASAPPPLSVVAMATQDNSSEVGSQSMRGGGEKSRFELFWENQCASDWSRAMHSFSYGLNMFLINLILVGWVRFWPMLTPAITVTVVSLCTLIFLGVTVNTKWLSYLFTNRKPASPAVPAYSSGSQNR